MMSSKNTETRWDLEGTATSFKNKEWHNTEKWGSGESEGEGWVRRVSGSAEE